MEVVAAIAVINGKVLIARKKPGKPLEGFWEFPGGKVEVGETYQACLVREIQEEMGVEIEAGAFFEKATYDYPNKTITLIGIKAKFISQHFTLIDHDKIEWVPINRILDFNLAPADIPIANALIARQNEF